MTMYQGDVPLSGASGSTEYQRLANDIRAQIITGSLAPGDRLIEADLTETYDVSRGTVREAIRLLASERLVETVRGRSGAPSLPGLPRRASLPISIPR